MISKVYLVESLINTQARSCSTQLCFGKQIEQVRHFRFALNSNVSEGNMSKNVLHHGGVIMALLPETTQFLPISARGKSSRKDQNQDISRIL